MKLTEVNEVMNSKLGLEIPSTFNPEFAADDRAEVALDGGGKEGEGAILNPQLCEVFHEAVERIGRRWTGAIVQVMLGGASRYCEIRAAIPGISDRLLTERLKELESVAILTREVTEGRPPQVYYRLSEKGRALSPVLDSITAWAHRWEG